MPQASGKTGANTGKIILSLQVFLLLAALDQTVITTAMPRIIEQLGGFDRYSWATTGYLFTSTIVVPIAGKLSDFYGRKKSLLTAVILFVIASVTCGSVNSPAGFPVDGMSQLILCRLLQGIGGGAIVSLSFSVVGDLFAPSERGKYQGYFAAVFALASIIGPALGGYVADVSSWRWLFFVNLPVGAVGSLLFWLCFKETSQSKDSPAARGRFDFKGMALFFLASCSLLLALSLTPNVVSSMASWSPNIALFILFIVSLVYFVRTELVTPNPFLPVTLFTNKVILISLISLAIYGVGMFGSSLLVPLFMQSVKGMSIARSGAFLSPLILTVAISSIGGGQWMSRSGRYKSVVVTGLSLMTVGVFILAALPATVSMEVLLCTMLMVALGIGILLPVYTVVIQNAVSDELIGTVTGLSQFFRSIGGTLGVACLGTMLIYFYHINLKRLLDPSLPPAAVALMNNPLEPEKLKKYLANALPTEGREEAIEKTVKLTGQALYSSIQLIYVLYGAALAGTVLLNLLLEELPLRSTKTATSQETHAPS